MRESLTVEESSELVDLWRRRQRLSAADMGRMYSIVSCALQSCNPPELQVLGEGRQELIAQFIYAKVLRLDCRDDDTACAEPVVDDGHSAPSSSFALCAYFRRYLIDCTRSSAFRKKVSLGDQISENQLEEQLGQGEDLEACLAEYGLNQATVSMSAKTFIAQLAEPERILLCESFGREAAGGPRDRLVGIDDPLIRAWLVVELRADEELMPFQDGALVCLHLNLDASFMLCCLLQSESGLNHGTGNTKVTVVHVAPLH